MADGRITFDYYDAGMYSEDTDKANINKIAYMISDINSIIRRI